ncbi:MAG: hypothetical protein IT211_01290, partial [Armatimonadetes bacterium]|nr:hypothetical protein [Armatimonadota bacterium]
MKNRQDRAVQYSLSIIIAMFCMATTYAQQQPTPPPIIGWGFDEFHIGGEMLAYPSIGKDSFNMDFVYQYGGHPTMADLRSSGNDSTDRRNF